MLIFSARVGNLLDLIPFVQSSLTEETVDPHFKLVEDINLLALSIGPEAIGYGSQEDEVAALRSLSSIESSDHQLKEIVISHFMTEVLIAYQSGLIILWDVVEARVVAVQGDKVLQLKNEIDSQNNVDTSMLDETSPHHLEDKEISAICWASSNGSLFIVIMFDVTESLIRSISYQVCFAIFW
ncbi:Uncharacterized protein Adt_03649 [Abeliophyllum distichum]|uniref:Uncharacterized protein n=1 Tax=Abeliophyllum distichum TaxID=126358 RepID=A0ABD1VZ38_9LAMI